MNIIKTPDGKKEDETEKYLKEEWSLSIKFLKFDERPIYIFKV